MATFTGRWGRAQWGSLEWGAVGAGGAASYKTVVGVTTVYSPRAPLRYVVTVDALAVLGGDLTAAPPSSTVTYRSGVLADQRYHGSVPTLVVYKNGVRVGQTYTPGSAVSYRTVVGVRQALRGLLDGRVELIDAGRYRR